MRTGLRSRVGAAGAALALLAVLAPSAGGAIPGPPVHPSPFLPVAPLTPAQRAAERAPSPGTAKAPDQPVTRRLSDERRRSRWSYVLDMAYARKEPSRRSRAIHRLDTYTSDGTPELVLDLKERTLTNGAVWVLVRLPMRPNDTVGWVPRERLSRYHLVTTKLRISRRRMIADLYRNGRRIWSARVGIGKRSTPTPSGHFYARERLIPERKGTIYGDYAFGTSAYSRVLTDWPGGGVIGVHGTNQPWLIPGRPSHGCVRVRNPRIDQLWKLMPLGTPIAIH